MARILVIDDEHNIRTMIRLALQHVGHTVELAADGPDGLVKFDDGQAWDLTLLDQRMPGMEGLEVLREIRRRDPDALVIMITAFGTIDLAIDAMKAGATDFLRKPFTADVLRGAVRVVVEGAEARANVSADSTAITYGMTTLNGFRIETRLGSGEKADGERRYTFTVHSPSGEARECGVLLPVYVVELVKAYADQEQMPGGDRFWQAFCEEALANYVWQHADFPTETPLRVDDLTTGLRRWVDSAIAVNKQV